MIAALTASPLFGLTLTLLAYLVGRWLQKKTGSLLANPLLIATGLCIIFLLALDIPYQSYAKGGDVLRLLVVPATTALSLGIYRQYAVLKRHFVPVLLGCLVGSVVSIVSVTGLCLLFGLPQQVGESLVGKSTTTAIAIGIAEGRGGIAAIAVLSTMLTGLAGAMGAPAFAKLFGITNPVAQGIATGVSSHALGTTKAQEMGETQGAMSSIALCVSGLISVILLAFL